MVKHGCVIIMKSISPAPRSVAPELLCVCANSLWLPSPLAVLSARAEYSVDNAANIFPCSRPKAGSTCAQTPVKCDLALLEEEGV